MCSLHNLPKINQGTFQHEWGMRVTNSNPIAEEPVTVDSFWGRERVSYFVFERWPLVDQPCMVYCIWTLSQKDMGSRNQSCPAKQRERM